tara:strand:- start:3103 stop:3423 length:321 start_codon:yes stop_codon:yes gene_type:complete
LNIYKFKKKWGIKSNFQLVVIFIVFGITGSASVFLGEPILSYLKINNELFIDIYLGKYIYIFIKIILIFPLYQILLLIFGAIFFQFTFFWNIEKEMLKKIGFKKFF